MVKRIIFLLLIIYAFKGCTKDDICPPDTATTANLVIVFNDIANPSNTKSVNVLSVITDNDDAVEIISFENTTEIAIPLNTTSDTTKYLFKRSLISSSDTINNIDKITFVYQRREDYVNRACGFKVEYFNIDPVLESEGTENWIQEIIVNRDIVNDENSAHITVLH
jgi:hypothetical protein|tara:strand:+ start:77889 stop:78386 length:498 start_codon:yes stop_codon:yes gene_type:complete